MGSANGIYVTIKEMENGDGFKKAGYRVNENRYHVSLYSICNLKKKKESSNTLAVA